MTSLRTRSLVPWLLLGVTALIAWGSLYPFQFDAQAATGGLPEALSRLSWARAGWGDRVSNVLLYVPLGFCLFLALAGRFKRWAVILGAVLCGAVLSLVIEIVQVYIPARVPSLTDLTLNACGTLAGTIAGAYWRLLSRLILFPTVGVDGSDRGALAVIGLWLGWRFAPFVPHLDLGKLKTALAPLFAPTLLPGEVLEYLACWLLVAEAAFGRYSRQRGVEALLGLIAAVLCGRLLVAGQVFIASELLALLLLLPVLVMVNRLPAQGRRVLLSACVIAVLVAHQLAPFEFAATRSAFDFWPVPGWIDAGLPVELAALLRFLFLCAGLLWLLQGCGVPGGLAIAIVTVIVTGFEVLRLWLPGAHASITHPALALALGLLLLGRQTARADVIRPGALTRSAGRIP